MTTLTRPRQASKTSRLDAAAAVHTAEHIAERPPARKQRQSGSPLIAAYGIVVQIVWQQIRRRWLIRGRRYAARARAA